MTSASSGDPLIKVWLIRTQIWFMRIDILKHIPNHVTEKSEKSDILYESGPTVMEQAGGSLIGKEAIAQVWPEINRDNG